MSKVRFALLTGVRLGNTISIDWSQIDLPGCEIRFKVKSARTACGKVHILPITEPVLVQLANLGPKDTGRAFTYQGRPIKTWRTAWSGALRWAGLEGFRWHDLRHTSASWMVQSGVPLDVMQDTLGHANISTTMRYAHRETTAKRHALDVLASHLRHNATAKSTEPVEKKRRNAG